MKARLVFLSTLAIAACVPSRDNPHDPAVRPDARLVVFVDGNPSASGGRHQRWTLDGSESRDPQGALGTWSMALSSSEDCESNEGWDEVAAGDAGGDPQLVVASTTASHPAYAPALAGYLAAIADFDETTAAPDESGLVRRTARLTIGSSRTCVDLVVINRPPTVSLGPDLRAAPGGRWWTAAVDSNGDQVLDARDADPTEVELYADVADPDPGDADAIGASGITWRVRGHLATILDVAPRDGLIDDDKFVDASHRTIRYPAPIIPSRGSVEVSVSDIPGIIAATDEARVDVLSSHWVEEVASLQLSRLASGTFDRSTMTLSPFQLLAHGHGQILAAGTSQFALFDQRLKATLTGATTPFWSATSAADLGVIPHGALGWWIVDGASDQVVYATDLYQAASAGFMSSVEGTAASDFTAPPAIAAGLSDRAWVLGHRDGNALEPRLYRLDGYNQLGLAIDAPGGSAKLASDGAGGVWACGTSLQHISESGEVLLDDPLVSGCLSMSYDERAGTLWLGMIDFDAGLRDTFTYRDGVLTRLFVDDSGAIADGSGNAILPRLGGFNQFTGFRRFNSDGVVVETVAYPESALTDFLLIEGGTLVANVTVAAERRLAWFEAADAGEDASIDVVLLEGDQPLSFAVDPVTGFVWMWDPLCSCIRVAAADGSTQESPPFTVPDDPRVALAIDPAPSAAGARTLWMAWSDADDGGLVRLAIPTRFRAPVPAVEVVPLGFALKNVSGLDVAPGDRVCIGAQDHADFSGGAPYVHGLSVDVATGVETVVTQSNGFQLSIAVAAQAALPATPAGCWWLQRVGFSTVTPLTAFFTSDSGSSEHSLIFSGESRTISSIDLDHFAGRVHAPTNRYATVFGDDWMTDLVWNDADNVASSLTPVTRGGVTADLVEVSGIWNDRFYRQSFIGVGSSEILGSVPGRVIRLDEDLREVASHPGYVFPRVRGAR